MEIGNLKKIVVISLNYRPELTGVARYSGDLAEYLAAEGFDVRVICAQPYYPFWETYQGYSSWKYTTTFEKNVRVTRVPLYVPKNVTGFKRIIHLFSFALMASPIILKNIFWRPNLVVCVSPTLVVVPFAIMLSFFSKAKSWLHIQDLELDAAAGLGLVKGNLLLRLLYGVESFLLKKFDSYSTISLKMKEILSDKIGDSNRVNYLPNWVDVSGIYPISGKNCLEDIININCSGFVCLYSGNLGFKQGIDLLIEVAKLLALSDIKFIICGDGPMRSQVLEAAKHYDNIFWLPLQENANLNFLMNLPSLHIVAQKSGVDNNVLPSKLITSLASGVPVYVVAPQSSELAEIARRSCILSRSLDAKIIAEDILLLSKSDNLEVLKDAGARGRSLAIDQYDMRKILAEFGEKLVKLSRD